MRVLCRNQPICVGRHVEGTCPGLCGIVKGSILPGYYGLEAGQSAVGDIFNWFVNYIQPLGKRTGSHEALSAVAAKLAPGESGLLALDWNHGNRTILVDPRLTGLLLGQTLYTNPAEIYRALIEATAFGALLTSAIAAFERITAHLAHGVSLVKIVAAFDSFVFATTRAKYGILCPVEYAQARIVASNRRRVPLVVE